MTGPQGKGSAASIERLCSLAGVSRASFYRDWASTAPGREETELRDLIQRAVLASKHYGPVIAASPPSFAARDGRSTTSVSCGSCARTIFSA